MMLLQFIIAFQFRKLSNDIPMEHHFCGANINGHIYDASEMASKMPVLNFTDLEGEHQFYLRFCDDIRASDLPEGISTQYGASGIAIQKSTGEYEPFNYHFTQTYSIPNNYEDGFFIYSLSESFHKLLDQEYYYVIYDMKCKEGSEDLNPISIQTIPFGDSLSIIITFENKYGCYTMGNVPATPTKHHCNVSYPPNVVYPFGISFKLDEIVAEPRGFPIPIDANTYAMVKICGTSTCPPNLQCDSEESGVWVCSAGSCRSFGTLPTELSKLYDNPDEGVLAIYNDKSRQTKVAFRCDFTIGKGEISVINKRLNHDTELLVSTQLQEVCIKAIEASHTYSCQAQLSDIKHQISVDLTALNYNNGYRFNVSIKPWGMTPDKTYVQIQPCGVSTCPGDICETAGANIWLCKVDKGVSICEDYGLYENSVEITPFTPGDLSKGLYLTYKGTAKRLTHIHLRCNRSLPEHQMTFDQEVNVDTGKGLQIVGYSSDYCIEPTPRPEPTLPVPTPYPTSTPTPGPIPSLVYQDSEVRFDLSSLYVNKTRVALSVRYTKSANEMQSVMMFIENGIKGCPRGYTCLYSDEASIYKCFDVYKGEIVKTCFSVADVRYGIEINRNEFIYYGGYGGYSTKVIIECNRSIENNKLLMDEKGFEENRMITLYGYSNAFCPKEDTNNHKTSGGSVFLFILYLIAIGYFGVGTLVVYLRTKQVDIPNKQFWSEVGESIMRVFCRRNYKYDKI
ncbi:hypothetical protein GPJ56_004523 [Histomonas meleagridis]|uniref:uncharacterized protein n=1 Tax=Histomonas meleagridis TaxID=135588 RepID=UPI00355AC47A|nr:hypothetical protein GPJ56_004523 [Histomonas meleagridis]KAH0797342.1 hypothetical protein GO595_009845 [Histomonas meleagridis]